MGFSFYSTGCVKRPKECWNENHTICALPCGPKTKEKPAGVNRRPLETPPAHTPHHMPGRESLWQSSETLFPQGPRQNRRKRYDGQRSALLICDHESLRNLWPTALDGLSKSSRAASIASCSAAERSGKSAPSSSGTIWSSACRWK